jgi:hypothetical protein
LENWKRGAAFENVGAAIQSSILKGTYNKTNPSDIDALLMA